jgi:hypothetical protein
MAAREIQTPAIVIRRISDLLDNKTQGEQGFVPRYNSHQLKAAKHAFAFALSILTNLDVSWIPNIATPGAGKRRVTFTVSTDYANKEKVTQRFEQMFDDDLIDNFTVTKSSVKISADIESGHAMLVEAARKGGLLDTIAGYEIRTLDVSPSDKVQAISILYDEILGVRPDLPGWEQRLEHLLQTAELYPSYTRLLREIVRQAKSSLPSKQRAKPERFSPPEANLRETRSDTKMRVIESFGRTLQEANERFKNELESASAFMGAIPALPSNEIRNALDHLVSGLGRLDEDNVETLLLHLERARKHMDLALFDCMTTLARFHFDVLSRAAAEAEATGRDVAGIQNQIQALLEKTRKVKDPPATNRESLDLLVADRQTIQAATLDLKSLLADLEEQYVLLERVLGPEDLRRSIDRTRQGSGSQS